MTAVALLEASLRNADSSDVGALLNETWTGDDLGLMIRTLMSLFNDVVADAPERAQDILAAHRLACLRRPNATPSSSE